MARRTLLSPSRLGPPLVAAGAAAVTLAATVVLTQGAQADVVTVGGGAFGASGVVTRDGSTSTLAPTPSVVLPPGGGGPFTARAASASLRRSLLTGELVVSTQGDTAISHTRTVRSSARVVDVSLLDGRITADAVSTSCLSNGDGSSGSTTLTGLNPPQVPPTPAPNTVVTLSGIGTVTYNEQVEVNTPGVGTSIVVNGIHVRLSGTLGTGEIVLAQSRCAANGPDVLRPSPPPPPSPSSSVSSSPSPTPSASTSSSPSPSEDAADAADATDAAPPAEPVSGEVGYTG